MIETIEAALQPIRNSLEVDGFDLKVEGINDGVVSVVVFAGHQPRPTPSSAPPADVSGGAA